MVKSLEWGKQKIGSLGKRGPDRVNVKCEVGRADCGEVPKTNWTEVNGPCITVKILSTPHVLIGTLPTLFAHRM